MPRGGITETLGADGHESCAGAHQIERVAAALHAAHSHDRDLDRLRDRMDLRERDRLARPDPDVPPVRPPSHGSPVFGSSAMPRTVLISDTRVGAGLLRGLGDRRDVAGVRGELDDQRLGGQRSDPLEQRAISSGSAPMISPVSTFGHETFSSSALTTSSLGERLGRAQPPRRG